MLVVSTILPEETSSQVSTQGNFSGEVDIDILREG